MVLDIRWINLARPPQVLKVVPCNGLFCFLLLNQGKIPLLLGVWFTGTGGHWAVHCQRDIWKLHTNSGAGFCSQLLTEPAVKLQRCNPRPACNSEAGPSLILLMAPQSCMPSHHFSHQWPDYRTSPAWPDLLWSFMALYSLPPRTSVSSLQIVTAGKLWFSVAEMTGNRLFSTQHSLQHCTSKNSGDPSGALLVLRNDPFLLLHRTFPNSQMYFYRTVQC